MKPVRYMFGATSALFVVAMFASVSAHDASIASRQSGRHLFERETTAPEYHHVGFTVANFQELYCAARAGGNSNTVAPFSWPRST